MPIAALKSETKPSILIVDDTAANLELLSHILAEQGYEPRPVPSGRLALAAARAEPPDLILLDILMPEMSGLAVCADLKADPALREIPVIFITALGETADKVRAFALGAADYLSKPFQIGEVQARVAVHLALHRQKRALRQSHDQLRELERLRDSLVHMIVHDLRSPLTSILLNLDLARMFPLPIEAAAYVGGALNSTRMLIALVSSLLDVSKLEAEQMTLEISAVDMTALVNATFQEIEPLRGQRRLTLTASGPLVMVPGDASLLRRVLQNLVANALRFTSEDHGVIAITITHTAEGKMRVAVADNGHGIPAEYQAKVFDKFYQVERKQQGQSHSSGLGLTFCKLAVEAHRGQIGVNSDVGKGSTFWFELPLLPTGSQ